jgi:hypothetical protein
MVERLPATTAFQAAKGTLVAAVLLAHPAPKAVRSLAIDGSDTHVGGVLQQLAAGSWQPPAFFLKKLLGTGTWYFSFDRELLIAFSTVRHFRFLLDGRCFRLLTDHKPLVTSLFCTMPPGRPANNDSCLSLANLHLTSDTRQARRMWSQTP